MLREGDTTAPPHPSLEGFSSGTASASLVSFLKIPLILWILFCYNEGITKTSSFDLFFHTLTHLSQFLASLERCL